ncbi:unnamed protein product [Soboliphyme baturini]|uniref:CHK domain-containing protein n=1 Tax=Soboliphyme baturini TaxID=241478 RepID=A0A183IFB9_9BILA|nr:unnamed protein product [Soboliphyme baturini]
MAGKNCALITHFDDAIPKGSVSDWPSAALASASRDFWVCDDKVVYLHGCVFFSFARVHIPEHNAYGKQCVYALGMNVSICGGSSDSYATAPDYVTAQDSNRDRFALEMVVQDTLRPMGDVRCVSVSPVDSMKRPLSSISRVRLRWPDEPLDHEFPTSIIVKVAMPSKDHEASQPIRISTLIRRAHNVECLAYALFAKDPPIPVPRCFANQIMNATQPGYLILDDLSGTAAAVEDLSVGVNGEQLKNVAAALARLHAWSCKNGKTILPRIPCFSDWLEFYASWFKRLRFALNKVKLLYPSYFSNMNINTVCQLLSPAQWLKTVENVYKTFPTVVTHGDLWLSNLFFEVNPDGSLGNRLCGIIDWQFCHGGSFVQDLAYLCSWNVSTEMNEETFHTKSLVMKSYDEAWLQAAAQTKNNLKRRITLAWYATASCSDRKID